MEITTGMVIEGKVTGITKFGMFVGFEGNKKGLVHISEISNGYVREISDLYKINDTVKVKVLSVDTQTDRISLSIKQISRSEEPPNASQSDYRNKRSDHTNSRNTVPYSISISKIPEEIYHADKNKDKADKYGKENPLSDFEEMMEKYKKQSSERISDMKKSMESKNRTSSFHSGNNVRFSGKKGTGSGNKQK